jgi:hypothetical protein
MAPNDAVGKVFLMIFVRCKSLIYIDVKFEKATVLDFFYSLNVQIEGRAAFGASRSNAELCDI